MTPGGGVGPKAPLSDEMASDAVSGLNMLSTPKKKGKRSPEMFKKVVVPDYSVLLDWRFWTGDGAWSGISASDENAELTAEEKVFASAAKRDTVKKVK